MGGAGRRGLQNPSKPSYLDTKATKANNDKKKKQQQLKKKDVPKADVSDVDENDDADKRRHHQQLTLNIFRDTFASVLAADSFSTTLQTIKQALFERNFSKAFEDPEALAVYATRWSPTRALCYASILRTIHMQKHLQGILSSSSTGIDSLSKSIETVNCSGDDGTTAPIQPDHYVQLKALCIGGGAAEIVAFGSFLSQVQNDTAKNIAGNITLVDSAPWDTVISQLQTSLTAIPPHQKYASQSVKDASKPMISSPQLFSAYFAQQDVLSLSKTELLSHITSSSSTQNPILVTLLFTLNELFTAAGILKPTKFLLDLTSVLPIGSLLLVVDSPGSYSETGVGEKKKKYPMQWLLDKVLLDTTANDPVEGRTWTKLESHDSLWFRLPAADGGGGNMDYPIPLENMRYQMHLYRVDAAPAV
ncbi:hypothetical protein B0H66DRAFT_162363 [Apodospora peruviana]|uniref:25S rRNA (Uridine(2843)-N(3))-methyltransferase n=1 Tax=Apodospora peruviana TaxID=516989 RepID=A0AAE0MBM6_9PEZI|nr:hypothetical protein B0H66DRAFT_162363 [Apodospora peruviana]